MELDLRVYQLESSYIEDTATSGNILRGFEGYQATRGSDRRRPRAVGLDDPERLFSSSSSGTRSSVTGIHKMREKIAGMDAAAALAAAASPAGTGASSHPARVPPPPLPGSSSALGATPAGGGALGSGLGLAVPTSTTTTMAGGRKRASSGSTAEDAARTTATGAAVMVPSGPTPRAGSHKSRKRVRDPADQD
ncbi:hypothetical protein BC828DRAFT_379171 [Blastocladiella britannica]|nr:hypothetical protein BC828DRAFT_379171 [Blastocladiella britannica]